MSSTNRGETQREPNDFYSTPPWLTEAVIEKLVVRLQYVIDEGRPLRVLEPAAGDGAMADVLEAKLLPRFPAGSFIERGDIEKGQDFLQRATPTKATERFDLIITNPPFNEALGFIKQGLILRATSRSVVAMILRLNFLGSKIRAAWLRANQPAVYVTPKRPSFRPDGKTDSIEYA